MNCFTEKDFMMTERRITEFHMHASSLDKMRLEHQLEALRERTAH